MGLTNPPARAGDRSNWQWGNWRGAALIIAVFVAALWVIQLVNAATGGALTGDGIRPRRLGGLWGVLWAPLLHNGFLHLVSNTVPLLVLGFLVLLGGLARFAAVTATVWLVSGAGVWLLGGGGTVVVGASGLVFGWLAYLVVRGVFTRNVVQMGLGLLILVIYGGLLWGVLPGAPGVSWQAHLFGAVGGVLAAAGAAGDREHRAIAP